MECVRQDEGDGGRLWDAMCPDKTLGTAANCGMRLLWLVLIIIKIP